MKQKSIYNLTTIFFHSNSTKENQDSFQTLFLDKENQTEKDERLAELWNKTPSNADESTLEDLEWLNSHIHSVKPQKNIYLYRIARIAAVLLLPFIGAVSAYFILPNNKETIYIEPKWTESFVSNGEHKNIILSDGTEVWLNSCSVLLYSENFEGSTRSLYLNGEASFNVAKNPDKPFIVKTNYMDVEALGTVFNVEAYSDSDVTIVTLEEGSVKVDSGNNNHVILSPDEQLIYNQTLGSLTKLTVDAGRVLQWNHGYLTFQRASFDYIMKTIERRFDVTINYETEKYMGRSFTMKFSPDEGLKQVLEILKEMIPDLNYRIKEDKIYIN